ncbi:MAG TPA: glycosyltransferase, partial [Salinivirgaceae bacterium]|nr:glycosyltransferase [Salinivirgaceae bacterium]
KNLPKILNQKYPNFEVFVALDACTDESETLIRTLLENYTNLRYTIIPKDPKFHHGKKVALTIAIKGAKHEHLLLTDADCYPASEHWISEMVKPFNQGYQLVLGYGKYSGKKSLLNKLVRYETFFIAQQYLGMAKAGIPYMGVGRNLAYTKELYYKEKGFAKHAHIESGDDDLFVNAVANKQNCYPVYSPQAHTLSEAPKSFKSWIYQKRRHFKTFSIYKRKHKFLLFAEPITREICWILPLTLLFNPVWMYYGVGIFLARFLVFLTVTKLNLQKLNEQKLIFFAPLFDLILPWLHLWIWGLNQLSPRKNIWK